MSGKASNIENARSFSLQVASFRDKNSIQGNLNVSLDQACSSRRHLLLVLFREKSPFNLVSDAG